MIGRALALVARRRATILQALALVVVYALATTVGPTSDVSVNDLYVYSVYADLVHHGLRPFADFGFEYPPLAIYPISLSGGDPWRLGIAMLGCLLVAQWCCERLGGPAAGWIVALSPLLTGALVRTHFDALPAALAIGGLLALVHGAQQREGGGGRRADLVTALGFALLAIGGMVKLWPLVLVPVAMVWLWARGQRTAAIAGAGVVAAISVAALAPYPWAGLHDAVRFHEDRPVQIESAPATVLWAVGRSSVTGDPVRPDAFKSNGLAGGPAPTVELIFQVAQIAALLVATALAARRSDPRHLGLCCLLAVLAFVALGKVLSPQYLVWLVPFAAVAYAWGVRVPALLTLGATAVTQLEFPRRYFDLVAGDGATFAIVALRNALLVAAGVSLAAALARSPSRRAPAGRSAPARP
jgi:hypothetical protein